MNSCFAVFLLFIFLFSFSVPPVFGAEPSPIIPDKELTILRTDGLNTPLWRLQWQKARREVQSEKFDSAAALYKNVVEEKPEIEPLRWEYCQVLFMIQNYQEAEEQLNILRINSPLRNDYQFLAGRIAIAKNDIQQAAYHFGVVLERDPSGTFATDAINGLAQSLRLQGHKELSLPLEEQRVMQSDIENKATLFADVLAVGDQKKVLWHLQNATDIVSLNISQIKRAIAVLSSYRNSESDTVKHQLYQELLLRNPEESSSRYAYAAFLQEQEEYQQALEQFEHFLRINPQSSVMLETAELAAGNGERPDRALHWYRRYLAEFPTKSAIHQKIDHLHKHLAKSFLANSVERNARKLWQKLTPYKHELYDERQPIFLQMADILRQKGGINYAYAGELLTVLQQEKIPDELTAMRLTAVYQAQEQWQKAVAAAFLVPEKQRNSAYYRMRAELELQCGREFDAALSYEYFLRYMPKEEEVRRTAMSLYGAAGLIEKEKALFAYYLTSGTNSVVRPDPQTLWLHCYWLSVNQQFEALHDVIHWAVDRWQDNPYFQAEIRLQEAEILRAHGRYDRAERILRQQLNRNILTERTLLALARTTADMGLEIPALEWLDFLRLIDKRGALTEKRIVDIPLVRMRLALQTGDIKGLEKTLLALLPRIPNNADALSRNMQRELIELCDLGKKKQNQVMAQFCHYHPSCSMSQRQAWATVPAEYQKTVIQNGEQAPHAFMLGNARSALLRQNFDTAKALTEQVRKERPDSVLALLILMEIEQKKGAYDKAEQLLNLGKNLLEPSLYCRKRISFARHAGHYARALSYFSQCYGRAETIEESTALAADLFDDDESEKALQFARLLWTAGYTQHSLAVYEAMLAQPTINTVAELYRKRFGEELPGRDDWWYLPTFFSTFLTQLESQGGRENETLHALLIPRIAFDTRGSEMGWLLARNSSLYRTLLRANVEYDARLAMSEKRFRYAEKGFRHLLSEENTPEIMVDLIALYHKTRQYQKEALLCKKMPYEWQNRIQARKMEEDIAEQENQLRPVGSVDFTSLILDSQKLYQNMVRLGLRPGFRYFVGDDREFFFHYEKVLYDCNIGERSSLSSNMVGIDMNWQIGTATDLSGGLRANMFDDNGRINFLYNAGIEHQFSGQLTAGGSWQRREVVDTIRSVTDRTLRDTATIDITMETPIGVGLGADIAWTFFSDGNSGRQAHAFLSHTTFYSNSELEWRYDGIYLEHEENSRPWESEEGDIESYWSPGSYNRHQFAISYTHGFADFFPSSDVDSATGDARHLRKNYFAVTAGAGIEDSSSPFYLTRANIFLEITPSFLLKGGLGVSSNDAGQTRDFSCGIQYRW